jgi:ABC-type spermidine/putrescine transport system permease subunit II
LNRLQPGSGIHRARRCGVLFGLLLMLLAVPDVIVAAALLRNPDSNWLRGSLLLICAGPFFLIGAGIVVASLIP